MSYAIGKAAASLDPQFSADGTGTGNRPHIHIYNGELFILADGTEFQYRPLGGVMTTATYASIGLPTTTKIQYSCLTSSGVLVRTVSGATYFITSSTTSTAATSNVPTDLVDCTAIGDGNYVIVAGLRPTIVAGVYQRDLVILEGNATTGIYTELDIDLIWTDIASQCYPKLVKRATDQYVLLVHNHTLTGGVHSPTGNGFDIRALKVDSSGALTAVSDVTQLDTIQVPNVVNPFAVSGHVCFWGGTKVFSFDDSVYSVFTSVFTDVDLAPCTLSGQVSATEWGFLTANNTFYTTDGVNFTKQARVVAGYATQFDMQITGLGNIAATENDVLLRLTEKHFPAAGFAYLNQNQNQIDRFILTDGAGNELNLAVYELNTVGGIFKAYARIPAVSAGGAITLKWDLGHRQVRQKVDPFTDLYEFVVDGEFASMRNLADGAFPIIVDAYTDVVNGGTHVGGTVDAELAQIEWSVPFSDSIMNNVTMQIYMNSSRTNYAAFTNYNFLLLQNKSTDYWALQAEDADRCDYYGSAGSTTRFLLSTPWATQTDVAWAVNGNNTDKYLVYNGAYAGTVNQKVAEFTVDAYPSNIRLQSMWGDLYIARYGQRDRGQETTTAEQNNYMDNDSVVITPTNSLTGDIPTTSRPPVNGVYHLAISGYTAPSTDFDAVMIIDERILPDEFWSHVTVGSSYTGEIVVQDKDGVDVPTKQVHLDPAKKEIELQARVTVSATGTTYIKIDANTGNTPSATGLYDNLYLFAFSNRDAGETNLVDGTAATVDGVGRDATGKFNADTMLYWNYTSLQSLADFGLHVSGNYYSAAQQTLMTVSDSFNTNTNRSAVISDNGNERGGWATQGSWLYGGGGGLNQAQGGAVATQMMHGRNGQGRQLFYRGVYDNQVATAVTNSGYAYFMLGASYSGNENLTGWVYHARISNQDETVFTDEHLEFEARNFEGTLVSRWLAATNDEPVEKEFDLTYDLTWMSTNVSNWVCKITEAELPTGFWDEKPEEARLAVYDQGGVECDTYVAHFDDVAETLTVYAKVPTMTAGASNTITLRMGGAIKAHTTNVFSDYVAVVDVAKNIDTDVTGLLSTVGGVTAVKPASNYFNQNYMYIDVSANSSDFQTSGYSLLYHFKRDVGSPQGDMGGLNQGASGNFAGVSLGDGDHFQSFRTNTGWIQNEADGFATLADTEYAGTIWENGSTDIRYAMVDETHVISEGGNTGLASMDRLLFGNAEDRTTFQFTGYLYEVRLSHSIHDQEHHRLNNFGLLNANITVGALVLV